jgi:hypothetical protein
MKRLPDGPTPVVRLLLLALSGMALMELLFDPLAWMKNVSMVAQVRAALPAARRRWQAWGISDYDLEAKGFVPLSCMLAARLKVRHGDVVAVEAQQTPWDDHGPWAPVARSQWDLPFCSYAQLTVAHLFEKVERNLAEADLSVDALDVQFDPVYGFVTSYDYRSGYRQGLLHPVFSECCIWFAFSHFQMADGSKPERP